MINPSRVGPDDAMLCRMLSNPGEMLGYVAGNEENVDFLFGGRYRGRKQLRLHTLIAHTKQGSRRLDVENRTEPDLQTR